MDKLAYSIESACTATDLSRSSIYRAIRDKKLPAFSIGGRRLIAAEDLVSFVNAHRTVQ